MVPLAGNAVSPFRTAHVTYYAHVSRCALWHKFSDVNFGHADQALKTLASWSS